MANLPIQFRKSSEVAATYNFDDITEGTGLIQYYGCKTSAAPTASYAILTEVVYSDGIETAADQTYNFDSVKFNLPKTAKGTAYINISTFQTQNDLIHVDATIKKISADEATITNISNTVSYSEQNNSPNLTNKTILFAIPIIQTIIKKGEKLRLTLVISADGSTLGISHDPKNRTGTNTATSVLSFLMPFRIDS